MSDHSARVTDEEKSMEHYKKGGVMQRNISREQYERKPSPVTLRRVAAKSARQEIQQ